MLITCVICSELITNSDEIFSANCGHLFHHSCFTKWLERSKTCPQCRSKTTEKNIHRIYFNVANIAGQNDPSSLQNTIDGLKFKIRMKDMDVKNAKEERDKEIAINHTLRKEVANLEEKLASSNSALLGAKQSVSIMKNENKRMNGLSEENKRLKERVQTLCNLETIRSGSSADVDDLLNQLAGSSSESRSLATYCSALKRELQEMERKKKTSQNRMKEMSQNLVQAYAERDMLKDKLRDQGKEAVQIHEEIFVAHREREVLEKRLKERNEVIKSLQQSDGQSAAVAILNKLTSSSPSKGNAVTEILRMLSESPAPEDLLTRLKRAAKSPTSPNFKKGNVTQKLNFKDEDIRTPHNAKRKFIVSTGPQLSDPTLEEDMPKRAKSMPSSGGHSRTPYQVGGLPSKNGFSIFKKSRLCTQPEESLGKVLTDEVYYDGMGGHKKQDNFPNPRRQTVSSGVKPKIKRPSNQQSKGSTFNLDSFLRSPL